MINGSVCPPLRGLLLPPKTCERAPTVTRGRVPPVSPSGGQGTCGRVPVIGRVAATIVHVLLELLKDSHAYCVANLPLYSYLKRYVNGWIYVLYAKQFRLACLIYYSFLIAVGSRVDIS